MELYFFQCICVNTYVYVCAYACMQSYMHLHCLELVKKPRGKITTVIKKSIQGTFKSIMMIIIIVTLYVATAHMTHVESRRLYLGVTFLLGRTTGIELRSSGFMPQQIFLPAKLSCQPSKAFSDEGYLPDIL